MSNTCSLREATIFGSVLSKVQIRQYNHLKQEYFDGILISMKKGFYSCKSFGGGIASFSRNALQWIEFSVYSSTTG